MRVAIDLADIRNGRILLVRKRKTWILPGGKPETGESDMDCLKREVEEETAGIICKNPKYYKSISGITPHKRDKLKVKIYLGNIKGKIKPRAEINKIKWIKNPEKYNLSHITKKIIESLRQEGYL